MNQSFSDNIVPNILEPESIVQAHKSHEQATYELRDRMDRDYRRYRLDLFDGTTEDMNEEQRQKERGFRHYTSNEPRTFANKILGWISLAQMVIKVDNDQSVPEERRTNNAKERFAIGMLRRVNDRLKRLMLPNLQDTLGFDAAIRGRIFGRALIYRNLRGETVVDVTPFDPRTCSWGMGANGLLWLCHKTRKSRAQIMTEYGVDVGEGGTEDNAGAGVEIYDYYDGDVNVVVKEGEFLKQPTPHGSPRIPIFYGIVGPSPRVSTEEITNLEVDFGESIFAANRNIYDNNNLMLSIMLELAARSREPGTKIFSADGEMTLDDDPHKTGSQVSLRTGVEDITLLEQPETGATFLNFAQLLMAEREKGSISSVNFGSTPFSLSGFAINSLRDQDSSALMPPLRCVEDSLLQIANLLSDQYSTGQYDPVEVSGGSGRNYFKQSIKPEDVAMGGDYRITLLPRLPEDDAAKYAQAQIARDAPNGVPLMPDIWIHENVLSIQDTDNLADMIKEQMGERFSPMASMYQMYKAAINRGRPDQAQVILGEMMVQMLQQLMMTGIMPPAMTLAAQAQPAAHSPGAQEQRGLNPQQGGNAALGAPPPQPNMQQGPLVEPGTPRPGARSPSTVQLNNIGLFGPDE